MVLCTDFPCQSDYLAKMQLNAHSTRLFPKNRGAHSYAATGIAARCDWAVMSDREPPQIHICRNVNTDSPRHIFLSLRSPFIALSAFATQILPTLADRFVLVSGSEDITIPNQCDRRWRQFDDAEHDQIRQILHHPLLNHWFVENLDEDVDSRISPLPTGMVFPVGPPANGLQVPAHQPLRDRQLRVFVAHRLRDGPQWEQRRHVSVLARTVWAPWCTVLDEEVPEDTFLNFVQAHAFVLCVEGGGLDPSPKAWQAILYGAIPIIRKTGTHRAYAELPVAFVPDWTAGSLTLPRLRAWHRQFILAHGSEAQRLVTLNRLSLDYWWSKIEARSR